MSDNDTRLNVGFFKKVVAKEVGKDEDQIDVVDVTVSEGCGVNENFSSSMKAVKVAADIAGRRSTFWYMCKCYPQPITGWMKEV
jgi:hypothetical protein